MGGDKFFSESLPEKKKWLIDLFLTNMYFHIIQRKFNGLDIIFTQNDKFLEKMRCPIYHQQTSESS